MTMVPAAHQNVSRRQQQHHHHHHQQQEEQDIIQDIDVHRRQGGDYYHALESFGSHMSPFPEGYCYYNDYGRLRNLESDLVALGGNFGRRGQEDMAEDESRTSSSFNEKTGSSSKDFHDEQRDNESWLQLRIGNSGQTSSSLNNNDQKFGTTPAQRGGGGLVELDLLPITPPPPRQILPPPPPPPIYHLPEIRGPSPRPVAGFMSGNIINSASGASSWFLQQGSGSSSSSYFTYPHQQDNNSWAFIRPAMTTHHQNYNIPFGIGSFSARPHHHHHQIQAGGIIDVRRPSMGGGVRVIDAPRRSHSGIWFMLQASPNQSKEPFLPQISKSYLRIKDGRMTVRLLMKYLVNKLTLDNESEVEITCRGQELLPFLTLQHVRDNIWSQRDAITLLPDSSTTDHLMVLHYGRRSA